MLHNISWGQFISTVLILLAIYYSYVIIAYFRKDLLLITQGKSLSHLFKRKTVNGSAQSEANFDKNISIVHELMASLNQIFDEAVSQQFQKPQLLIAIQLKLADYPQLKDTPFQEGVNNHLTQTATNRCDIELTASDLQGLW